MGIIVGVVGIVAILIACAGISGGKQVVINALKKQLAEETNEKRIYRDMAIDQNEEINELRKGLLINSEELQEIQDYLNNKEKSTEDGTI